MDKYLYVLIIFISFLVLIQILPAQIIADHNAVLEFDNIPDYWLNEAKKFIVHYGHTSHGSQILGGIYWIEDNIDSKYKIAVTPRNSSRSPVVSDVQDALRIWEEGLHPDTRDAQWMGYWDGSAALNGTIDVLNSGLFNISGWSWCGEVANNEWSYIQQYLDAMMNLRIRFPNIKFFYMTGHLTAQGPPNYQQIEYERLISNNEGIRQHVIDTEGILFDFADIEVHDPASNYYSEEDGTCPWCSDYVESHQTEYPNLPPLSDGGCGVNCSVCAHTNGLQCVMKGKAFWWMLAKIAGWQKIEAKGPSQPQSLRIR